MSEEEAQEEVSENKETPLLNCKCHGVRYYFMFSGCLAMTIVYALRVNMSIAIVAMVNKTAVYGDSQDHGKECAKLHMFNQTDGTGAYQKDGEFTWSPAIQGVILGSFYYGYSVFQIPGGRLAELCNSKWIFGLGTGLSALLSLLIPVATQFHVGLLIAVRTMQGLVQGVCFPAMYSLLGLWAPDPGRTLMTSVVMCGINIGTVVGIPMAALLCNSHLFGGWPAAFYVIGMIGCAWFFLWILTMMETPQECSCMTSHETEYITSHQTIDQSDELPPIPWFAIVTFGPYWVIILAQVVGDWTFFLILNDLPIFYSTILHFNIEENGLMSSLPFLLQSIVGISAGFISDEIIRRDKMSPTLVRRICNTIGCLGSATGLAISSLSGCSVIGHTLAFTLIMASGGFFYCSYMVGCLDLSPEYAGTLIGIANTLSNLTGFLTPMLVGALTDEHQTLARWRIVFILTIVFLAIASVLYFLFSTAEKQNWHSEYHRQRCAAHRDRIANFTSCWRKKSDSGS